MDAMTGIVLDHPYLATMLVFLLLFVAGVCAFPTQRRSIMLSACLGAPSSILALFVVPEYWKPNLIIDLPVGLEDFLFSFVTGGASWLLFCACRPCSSDECRNIKPRAGRYVCCILVGWVFYEGMRLSGFGYAWSIWISIYLFGVYFLYLKKPFGPAAFAASLLFVMVYALLLKGALILWPETLGYWGGDATRRQFFGMPWMEIAWALGYGFTWPLFMAYVFDLETAGLSMKSKA